MHNQLNVDFPLLQFHQQNNTSSIYVDKWVPWIIYTKHKDTSRVKRSRMEHPGITVHFLTCTRDVTSSKSLLQRLHMVFASCSRQITNYLEIDHNILSHFPSLITHPVKFSEVNLKSTVRQPNNQTACITGKTALNYIQTATIRLIWNKPYWEDML